MSCWNVEAGSAVSAVLVLAGTLVFALSGDHAWNVTGDAAVPAPITLADRQFQLWSTPHGVVKAALAGRGSMQGRAIAFAVKRTVRSARVVFLVSVLYLPAVLGLMVLDR